ncbi:glycosyltransferase [Klebsiella pneumoniae]|uniref:glycosyltransferase family 2 protein n=1 Tax=Klebsiella pneumoniae TaxID=573 RepID=UPI0020CCB3D9|nr:glycosyltransferase family 2 protein [Klebsiella pneumoniae]MCQ0572067.1 glycosyltransferase [Klebsiella pneumoniae]
MNSINIPTVSVIIPVYNVKDYVLQAIDSVINQKVKPFEVIIVDDGSTDGSGDIIDANYDQIPFIKIIHTINQGLGQARNEGTMLASGEFIYYFDSDDLLMPDLISDFIKIYKENPCIDVFAFSAESFSDESTSDANIQKDKLPVYKRTIEGVYDTGCNAFVKLSQNGTFFPNAWLYIFKKSLQSDNNLFFKRIIHEDEEFTPRLFLKASLTVITNKKYFKRRVRAGSIMQTSRSEKNIIGYLESINTLVELKNNSTGLCEKYLNVRIRQNIVHIFSILKQSNITLSQSTNESLAKVLKGNTDSLVFIAKYNVFIYKVAKYFLKRIGFIV